MKPKFNIDDCDRMTVVNCVTEKEANIFCRYLDSLGLTWGSGDRYTMFNRWSDHKDKTCYCPLLGAYCDIDYFSQHQGFTILKFSDFDWSDWSEFKPKFDIKKYKGKYAMHCDTEEKSKVFSKYLYKQGRKWRSGVSYLELEVWGVRKEHTCYEVNLGFYGNEDWYHANGFTILEFDDFDWSDWE